MVYGEIDLRMQADFGEKKKRVFLQVCDPEERRNKYK